MKPRRKPAKPEASSISVRQLRSGPRYLISSVASSRTRAISKAGSLSNSANLTRKSHRAKDANAKSPETINVGETTALRLMRASTKVQRILSVRKRVRKSDSTPEGSDHESSQESKGNSKAESPKDKNTAGSGSKSKKKRIVGMKWFGCPGRRRNKAKRSSKTADKSESATDDDSANEVSVNTDKSDDNANVGEPRSPGSDQNPDTENVIDHELDPDQDHLNKTSKRKRRSTFLQVDRGVSRSLFRCSTRKRSTSSRKSRSTNSDGSSTLDASPPPRKKPFYINVQNWVNNGKYTTTEDLFPISNLIVEENPSPTPESDQSLKSDSAISTPTSTFSRRTKKFMETRSTDSTKDPNAACGNLENDERLALSCTCAKCMDTTVRTFEEITPDSLIHGVENNTEEVDKTETRQKQNPNNTVDVDTAEVVPEINIETGPSEPEPDGNSSISKSLIDLLNNECSTSDANHDRMLSEVIGDIPDTVFTVAGANLEQYEVLDFAKLMESAFDEVAGLETDHFAGITAAPNEPLYELQDVPVPWRLISENFKSHAQDTVVIFKNDDIPAVANTEIELGSSSSTSATMDARRLELIGIPLNTNFEPGKSLGTESPCSSGFASGSRSANEVLLLEDFNLTELQMQGLPQQERGNLIEKSSDEYMRLKRMIEDMRGLAKVFKNPLHWHQSISEVRYLQTSYLKRIEELSAEEYAGNKVAGNSTFGTALVLPHADKQQ